MSWQRLLMSQIRRANADQMLWTYPLLVGAGWFIWDALDEEWLVSLNLATDPEAVLNRVEKERLERQEAALKAKQTVLKSPGVVKTKAAVVEEEDEPEEEEVEEEEKDEDANAADDDVPAGEDGDDADEDEEEEEETEIVVKPLYIPTKGKKLSTKEVWDNFTIKALNMSEDDDDDEEEEEEEEEDEE